MNLCLACRDVQPDAAGGLARATRDLAAALAHDGHDVHLLTNRSASALPELPGVFVTPLFVGAVSGRFAAPALDTASQNLQHAAAVYREVRRIHDQDGPVDAVLAPLWRSEGAVCALDDRFPTIVSCMTSIQTLTELDPKCHLVPDIEERVALEREALRRCRYLHGLTEAALDKTIRDHRLAPDATAVIGRGLWDRRAAQLAAVAVGSARAAGARGPVRVLFVGRIEHRKGVDTLLAAARQLIDAELDVTFTLAGPSADPGYRESFEEHAWRDPRLREAIRFTGGVSDAELAGLYAGSDIVCAPSRYESHGIVLLEAMMFGKPIVTCDAGGISEVVKPDHDALVVAPDDAAALAGALQRLSADPELRARLGAAARQAYEARFDIHLVAGRMKSFIEEVRVLHRLLPPGPEGVDDRLQRLLEEVLGIDPSSASQACEELLDPPASPPLRRIRAAALASPPPRPAMACDEARVTAVILTRDRPELVGRALDSLRGSMVPLEVLVIDNASAPAAARRLAVECSKRPLTELRRSEQNLGCAGGRSLGVELARTELVLFLDDDAELMPGALEHLTAELDAHPAAGAVCATVVGPDGLVLHSGGVLRRTDELATFEPFGAGLSLDSASLGESGSADWVPGTVALIRRSLLTEFAIDQRMSAYFEDAEWCYRISLQRQGVFRRSRKALAVHNFQARPYGGGSFEARSAAVRLVAACARFYELHGVLLAPAVFEVLPEMRGHDGVCDLPAARLLMELMIAKGPEWTLAAWMRGDLGALLGEHGGHPHHRGRQDLARMRAELLALRQLINAQDEALTVLHQRNETLCRIEQGGWWRLRGRILVLTRLARRLSRPSRALRPAEPKVGD